MSEALHREALAALLQRPHLARLLAAFNGGGEETRVVGGAIRNALLGRPVTEMDCATTALPEVTMERARCAGFKAVPTGIEHGTVTVVVDGEPFEVTTLREDVETDGRRATVRFGRDFAADARRRDFTINALFLGLDGTLHDYTGGEADIAARRVRFIGDARTRIREDYLRILRFFRFSSEYADGPPDAEGLAAAAGERAGLARLSHERIRAELLKLLVTRHASESVRLLSDHGFLTPLLGGVAEFGRFDGAVAREPSPDPVRRLAALAVLVEEDAERLRERLRLSNEETQRLRDHGRMVAVLKTGAEPLDALAIRRIIAAYGLAPLSDALHALDGEPRPQMTEEGRAALARYLLGEEALPVFPLRGADLVSAGVPPGPGLGEALESARRDWIAQGCPEGESARVELLRAALAGMRSAP